MASIDRRALKSGVAWRVRWRDETGKQNAKHFPRKADAQRFKTTVESDMLSGKYVSPAAGLVTFRSFYDQWSKHQLWESGTREGFDLVVKQAEFADLPLGKIKRSHVESWVKAMDTKNFAPQTIRNRLAWSRTVFRAAIADQHLAVDPSAGVRTPRLAPKSERMTIPTADEVRTLLEHSPAWFKPMIALGAFGGLRIGEVNGLQGSDVDFLRRTIKVNRQVQRRAGSPLEIRAPKYQSFRTVSAPEGLLTILSQHMEQVGLYGDDGWFMPGRDGGAAWPRTVDYHWTRTRDAAGLRVTFHSLRHFYASGLIAAGCDVVTVQHALGHKSASVTLDVYSHLWETSEDTTRAAAQGLVDAVLSSGEDSLRTQSTS